MYRRLLSGIAAIAAATMVVPLAGTREIRAGLDVQGIHARWMARDRTGDMACRGWRVDRDAKDAVLRPFINTGLAGGGAADEDQGNFGPIALYAGGSGEVRYRDVSYKDVAPKTFVKEQLSPNFRMQRLNPLHYAWSAAAADFNRDGNIDIVSGPYIYLGPDFTKALDTTILANI